MNTLSDGDKGVGQRAGASLVLWLRGGVVAEHPLDVETQHETHQAARLTVLRETDTGRSDCETNCGSKGKKKQEAVKTHLNVFNPGFLQKFNSNLSVSWYLEREDHPPQKKVKIISLIRYCFACVRTRRDFYAPVLNSPRLLAGRSNVCAALACERWWSSCSEANSGSPPGRSDSWAGGAGRWRRGSSSLRLTFRTAEQTVEVGGSVQKMFKKCVLILKKKFANYNSWSTEHFMTISRAGKSRLSRSTPASRSIKWCQIFINLIFLLIGKYKSQCKSQSSPDLGHSKM